ncbi:hypothetical protein EGW08_016352, partial [Elysia chlorotica]
VKYLGEDPAHQRGILAAVSVNQGYDVNKALSILKSWRALGRFYVYVMTANQKQIIQAHQGQLLSPENKEKHGIDESRVWNATSLDELDEALTVRLFGYKSVEDYYTEMSSYRHIPNIKIPLLILNAEDDPVVPRELLVYPHQAVEAQPYTMFVLTKHGGHLGFYENGFLRPSEHTWMDRLIMEYSDAITNLHSRGELPQPFNVKVDDFTDSTHTKVKDTGVDTLLGPVPDKFMNGDSVSQINNNVVGPLSDKHWGTSKPSADKYPGNINGDAMGNNAYADGVEVTGMPQFQNLTEEGGGGGVGVRANSLVMLGCGDSLASGRGLVLEALKKSTNTAQL